MTPTVPEAAVTIHSLGTSKSLLEQFLLKNKKFTWYVFSTVEYMYFMFKA